jgi:hypothetical protein
VLKLEGLGALNAKFDAMIKRTEKKIVLTRKQVAQELIEALIVNIPVWSGKTVRSVAVGNAPTGGNAREPHPDRQNYALEGEWRYHEEFGPTSRMKMGTEPMRPRSEAIARASVNETDYSLDKPVFVSSDAYLWELVERAEAGKGRNKAVVSQIALAQVKAKFGGLVK